MAKLTEAQRKLHDEALAEGFKDETCPTCGTEFLAHIHFIRCDTRPCPMQGAGPTLLDWLAEGITPAGRSALGQADE